MLSNLAPLRLPENKLMLVDVEGHTTDIRFNPNKSVYFIGVLEVNEGKNVVRRFTNVDQAIAHIQSQLEAGWYMIAHNGKFDYSALKVRGLKWTIEQGKLSVICTMVMAYFRESNLPSFSLDSLTGMKTDVVQACVDKGLIEHMSHPQFWETDWSDHTEVLSVIADYCVDDLKATHKLYKRLSAWYNTPDNQKFVSALAWLEFPMLEVLSELEVNGKYVDQQRLSSLSHKLHLELAAAEQKLSESVGLLPTLKWNKVDAYEPFVKEYSKGQWKNKGAIAYYMDANGAVCASEPYIAYDNCPLVPYNSAAATGHTWWLLSKTCPEVLTKADKTKGGRQSLNKDFFKDVDDSIPESLPIARVMKLKKYISKVDEIYKHIQVDGRIHTNFNNCLTRTGRLSSSNPNLQNMPNPDRDPEFAPQFRQLFTAPTEDRVILVADLDRIEIVVLAWFLFSVLKDSGLLEVINSGADVHQANADRWNVGRHVAKTLIFLLVYGGSPQLIYKRGLAQTLAEAESMFAAVHEGQPTIQLLKNKVWSRAAKRGYITNPWNAHVPYPELNSKRKWEVAAGERMSFNCLIQRTARDIMHWLVIQSLPVIRQHGALLVNIVHDETIVECPKEFAEQLKADLNQLWLNRFDILPGIKVNGEWNIGGSWYEAK